MKFHPAAEVFDLLVGDDFRSLVTDIKTRGLRFPITTFNGAILDGRNRLRACKLAGVEPEFKEFKGTEDEALDFVVSANIERRHLNESQRAVAATKILPLYEAQAREKEKTRKAEQPREGGKFKKSPSTAPMRESVEAVEQVAAKFKVSPRLVQQAKRVVAESSKETIASIRAGGTTVGEAYREIITGTPEQLMKEVQKRRREEVEKKVEAHPRAVAAYMDVLKLVYRELDKIKDQAHETAQQDKFSPEAKQFIRDKHKNICAILAHVEGAF